MAILSKLFFLSLSLQLLLSLAAAAPSHVFSSSAYAPKRGACPSEPLVRTADGIGAQEIDYISKRKAVADVALSKWLKKVNPSFDTTSLPLLALTASGGGYRAMLSGAGIIQAFDGRDSSVSTSGLWQAISYHAGLSGGAWLVESVAGNNNPTISSLKKHWSPFIAQGALNAVFNWKDPIILNIVNDIIAKAKAGFEIDLVDPWGRILSQQLFLGSDGSVSTTLSGITALSEFASHQAPLPIVSSIGLDQAAGECMATAGSLQYEFSPFEFGSWDSGVNAFTQTKYLSTVMSNGQPAKPDQCVQGFDNIGYILGTSSNLFNSQACRNLPSKSATLFSLLQNILKAAEQKIAQKAGFVDIINPFYQRPESSKVANQPKLSLVDAGEFDVIQHGQGDPLWPLIHEARALDVIILSDASGDTADGYPNGNALRATLLQAKKQNLGPRMPDIPSADTFTGMGLNKRPTFFGCHNPDSVTLIWLPNQKYTFESSTSTWQFQYTTDQADAMIANSVQVATHGGDKEWATCLACGLMTKQGGNKALPSGCTACLKKYCYN